MQCDLLRAEISENILPKKISPIMGLQKAAAVSYSNVKTHTIEIFRLTSVVLSLSQQVVLVLRFAALALPAR